MQRELELAVRILRDAAAQEILPRFNQAVAERKGDGSLVTAADHATQAAIAAALARERPGSRLLGEEMDAAAQQGLLEEAADGVWVLDPLDGTSNYANGFPFFSVSIALVRDGEPQLGVILDPIRDECFTATRGGGAHLNGVPLRPFAASQALRDCIAVVDLKRLRPEQIARILEPGSFASQRNLGSVALDWCWIAAGRFQLYLHGGQKLWDYAAGRLIATEAGVASRQFDTADLAPSRGLSLAPRLSIAAANAPLLSAWMAHCGLAG